MGTNEFGNKKFNGLYIEVKRGKTQDEQMTNLDFALRKFKRMIKDTNLMVDIQKTMYYTKPSVLRKDQKSRSLARMRHINKINNE